MIPEPKKRRIFWEAPVAAFNVALGATSALTVFLILFLGGNLVDVGTFFTVYSGISVPSLLFWGKLSDKVQSRSRLLALSFGLSGAALWALASSRTVTVAITMGGLLAFFSSAMAPVASMMALEDSPKDSWNDRIGRLNAYINYGYGLGLLLDVIFTGYSGARAAFELSAGLSWLAGVGILMTSGGPPKAKAERAGPHGVTTARLGILERHGGHHTVMFHLPNFSGLKRLVQSPRERLAVLAILSASLFTAASSLTWTPIPAFLQDTLKNERMVFGLLFANSFFTALFFEVEGKKVSPSNEVSVYLKSLGLRTFIYIGYLAAVLMSGPLSIAAVVASISLSGMIWSVFSIAVTGMVAQTASHKERGTAIGTLNSLTGLASLAGSYLSGWLATAAGFASVFLGSAVLNLFSVALALPIASPRIRQALLSEDPDAQTTRAT
ncbi:MAG: MFS transporter [Thermoprotei archaeon]|nr:MFS transporter [TACK group archaeon]